MKTKQILLVILIVIFCQTSYAQLKVLQNGAVGIGTNAPRGKFQVMGNSYFTNSAGSVRIDGGSSNPTVGSSNDQLFFWYSDETNLNKCYAENFQKGWPDNSKSSTKIDRIDAISTLMELDPIYIKLEDSLASSCYDFSIESVKNSIPTIVEKTPFGDVVDFYQYIPIMVSAIQQQQEQIEILQKIVYSQEKEIINFKSGENFQQDFSQKTGEIEEDLPILQDNIPNPFNSETVIKYYIPKSITSAYIYIYDLQGKEMKSVVLEQKGNGYIIINSSELYAGMFVYTLIVDNKIIDSKRMILTSN